MASTGDILGTGVSALLAYQRALSTTGHNIANVNTDGFSRQRVDLGARTPQVAGDGFIGQGVNVATVERVYSQFLTDQVRTASSAFHQLDTLQQLAGRVDNLLSDSAAGLLPSMQDFFNAVHEVADDPGAIPARQVLLSAADSLVSRFHSLDRQLTDLRGAVNSDIGTTVNEINGLAQAIAEANQQIVTAQGAAGGQPANDLLDQRDQLVARLGELVSVSTVPADGGALNVFVGNGQALVIGSQARALEVIANDFDPTRHEVAFAHPNGSGSISDFLNGGRLGGLLEFRDEVLDAAQSNLGLVAFGVAETLNAQHRLGQDLNGDLGGDLFTSPQPLALANRNNTTGTNVAVSVNDVGALSDDSYRLQFDGVSAWTLRNLNTGNLVTLAGSGTDADPFIGDGLAISVQALGAGAGDSYRFDIQPTRNGARDLALAISDPAKLAVATPIRGTASLSNLGSGSIGVDGVSNVASLPLSGSGGDITLTFDGAIPGFSVSGGPGGSLAYDPASEDGGKSFTLGAPFDGISFTVAGRPADGDSFVIGDNVNGVGDNRNGLLLAGLQGQLSLGNGSASFEDVYTQLVAEVGTVTRRAEVNRDAQEGLLQLSTNARDGVSGVNLDEEAANLVRFQQAYQAAAQVINVADQMFDELFGILRR